MLIIDGKYIYDAFDSYHDGGYTLASVREKWPGNKRESQQKHRGSLSLTPHGRAFDND
jgi:hypothetical protein